MINVVCLTFNQSLCPARNIARLILTLEQRSLTHEHLMSVLAAQGVLLVWLTVPAWKAADARAWLRASQRRGATTSCFPKDADIYSPLIFAALMIGHHFSASAL
jgi:hypothetical protein